MSDSLGIRNYLDQFGSDDVKMLAIIVYNNTEISSMSAHEGMEVIKRLADRELEGIVLDALVKQGHEVSRSVNADGVIWTRISLGLDDGSTCMPIVRDAVSFVATVCKDDWPQALRDKVSLYFCSMNAATEKFEKKGGPPIEHDAEKRY